MNIAAFRGASSGAGGHGLHRDAACATGGSSPFLAPPAAAAVPAPNKRKRRPAGTPDPDAEVVALSPKTLMESDRYVCEICNQGFQRDQNLQMHRRRHKVPWKLLKRPNLGTTKRVYICPERSCLHHDPAHALGDLVGIKKHYRRKHCTEKQWQCEKCSKGYAVQSDYKAHLKTCGTRGHSCDCGRVFSRVESFIEHQDTCSAVKRRSAQSESPSQSSDTTQAMSVTQSGMSERSIDELNSTKALILDEHARRIQEAPATSSSPMPAWLTDAHSSGTTHLLPHADNRHVSRSSQITRCSSDSAAYTEVVSCPEKKMVLQPSLQLSIGPACVEVASSSPCTDIKPSFGNSMVLDTIASSGPTTVGLDDALARLVGPASSGMNTSMERAETVANFITALSSPVESSARLQSSTKPKHENRINRTETVAYYNPTGSTSLYLEHWAAGDSVHHESGADPALGARGLHHAQLEPASSSVITDYRQGLHMDVAETEHLFGARSVSNDQLAFRSQMAAAARATSADQKREADVHPARVGLARQECDEAERELARAETLKREAREQLQVAAAEKDFAERAREAAKRQVEISEAELASAQRLRAHAQAELQKATSSPSSFCQSCKSALELTTTSPPSPRSTSTSPTSWSMMAPYSPSTHHQTSKPRHMLTNPGIKRMSWSAFQQPDRKFDQIVSQDLDLNKIS